MKRLKKIIIPVLVFLLLVSGIISFSNEIVTEKQKYLSGKDEGVSTRELAILASLVYEDVPNDESWGKGKGIESCSIDTSVTHDIDYIYSVSGDNCFFTQERNNGSYKTIKKGGYNVPYFIEGMSERKMNSVFATAVAELEPGQEYYFLNFADVDELKDKWSIIDYGHKSNSINNDESRPGWSNTFDAITFKKGNNYVIAYRGTDFPDAAEWLLSDFGYAIKGVNVQTEQAYDYAQEQYSKIIETDSDAKVYITGHSLGAYLAQVGGAAIVDLEANRKKNDSVLTFNDEDKNQMWDRYTETYKSKNSNLEQVAYFNGMGVNGLFGSSDFANNIQNALVYLSTHDKNGNRIINGDRSVNYSNDVKSSGRLVLYNMKDDPISNIGLHYGEILKLEYGADAKTRHSSHTLDIEAILKKGVDLTSDDLKKITESYGVGKFTLDLFKSLYGYIKNSSSSNTSSASTSAIPKIVSNYIGEKYINYDAANVINNVYNVYSEYTGNKGITLESKTLTKILELFNVNHETDSFVCLLDKDNGYIKDDNLKLEVVSTNLKRMCTTEGCSFVNGYKLDNLDGYTYGDIITNYSSNQSLLLKATVTNACAKSYEWYYKKADDNDFTLIGTTENNQIYINDLIEEGKENSIYKYEFKVIVNYGDTYTPKTVSLSNSGNVISYVTSGTKYKTNPTLDDGINVSETYGDKEKVSYETSIKFNISYTDGKIDVYGYNQIQTRAVELNTNGKINCIDNNCYTNQKYSNDDNYITLKSNGNNHLWKYSLDGNEWNKLSDENKESIVIPENILNIKENSSIKIYIVDEQWKDNQENGQCTVDNNCIVNSTVLNYVYDMQAPKCNFDYNVDTIGITLTKKRFLGGYNTLNTTLKFVCTDNLSSFDTGDVTIDKFDVGDNGLVNNGIIAKKVSLNKDAKITSTIENKTISSRIPIKVTGIPSNQTYVHYNGGIKDLAGNTSKVEKGDRSIIYLKIYEGSK